MIQRHPGNEWNVVNVWCLVIHPHIKQGENRMLFFRPLGTVDRMPLTQHILTVWHKAARIHWHLPATRLELPNRPLLPIV